MRPRRVCLRGVIVIVSVVGLHGDCFEVALTDIVSGDINVCITA